MLRVAILQNYENQTCFNVRLSCLLQITLMNPHSNCCLSECSF